MGSEVIFQAKHMHKAFGPTIALKDVDFTLRRGEIRGLIGENGSGKSTIMSIASGMQPATSGEMFYMGRPWSPHSMIESQHAGISMVLQEANTIPGVTVAQNLFAGREEEFSRFGVINMRRMYRAADALLQKFGITSFRGRDRIDHLTFEDRKLTEIVRCVSDNTQILVVDETTTALSMEGRGSLYTLMHRMAKEGKAVVFISHDMDEILEQCTDLTVLRDGEIIGNLTRAEMDAPDAVKRIRYMMVGREIGEKYYREDYAPSAQDEDALVLDHITFGPIRDFCLTLKKGEIVGFGGLSGCGMHEIGRAAYGLEKLEGGRVLRGGREIHAAWTPYSTALATSPKTATRNRSYSTPAYRTTSFCPLSRRWSTARSSARARKGASRANKSTPSASSAQWAAVRQHALRRQQAEGLLCQVDGQGSEVVVMDCPTRAWT